MKLGILILVCCSLLCFVQGQNAEIDSITVKTDPDPPTAGEEVTCVTELRVTLNNTEGSLKQRFAVLCRIQHKVGDETHGETYTGQHIGVEAGQSRTNVSDHCRLRKTFTEAGTYTLLVTVEVYLLDNLNTKKLLASNRLANEEKSVDVTVETGSGPQCLNYFNDSSVCGPLGCIKINGSIDGPPIAYLAMDVIFCVNETIEWFNPNEEGERVPYRIRLAHQEGDFFDMRSSFFVQPRCSGVYQLSFDMPFVAIKMRHNYIYFAWSYACWRPAVKSELARYNKSFEAEWCIGDEGTCFVNFK